ncbi:Alpha-xylosidase [Kluyvera cryocrescens]|uniref:Alpha-xylosidase n=1 Tax=Kluyvera cryocrescens TaxID=580 RepID=A0A485AQ49_KLUCR|nr:Alpha-xylosidase [Kluyvera cryocrescens]
MSLPVYVRDNTLLALGNNNQKPDYAWHEGTEFQLFQLADGREAVCEVPALDGSIVFTLSAKRQGNVITVKGNGKATGWTLCLRNIQQVAGVQGGSQAGSELGVVVTALGKRTGGDALSPETPPHPNPLPVGERGLFCAVGG